MDRRGFMKGISLGSIGMAIGIPERLSPIKIPTIQKVAPAKPTDISSESIDFTDEFFAWLKSNSDKVKYPYELVNKKPITFEAYIQTTHGLRAYNLIAKRQKLKTFWNPEIANDLTCCSSDTRDSIEILKDTMFSGVNDELSFMYEGYTSYIIVGGPIKKFYLRQLISTATIFDPDNFCPKKGLLIQHAYLTQADIEKA